MYLMDRENSVIDSRAQMRSGNELRQGGHICDQSGRLIVTVAIFSQGVLQESYYCTGNIQRLIFSFQRNVSRTKPISFNKY
jgi:hypothetical protein